MDGTNNDIAIVGLGCRFPGEASDPKGLLSMLQAGRDAWSKIPKERFESDAYHHPSHQRKGAVIAQGGYFIDEDIARWDAPFFSMTPSEATAMDPQHRLILEVAYEALESAGIPMESIVGSETSVYVGCFTRDYEAISNRDIDATAPYQATGQGLAMLSNRLSWFYDLRGPSLTLDTACSSSLFALHLACQSIRNKESKMAIVGGTSLIFQPDIMRMLSALHFLSPDSRCFSFDERANGYARGEGLSAVILKPVQDALRDGDTIRAVIRATATNQDGRTPGITLPSMNAQASLIRTAYENANLSMADTQYFEAHGTGTPAGDPLELGALGATFGADSTRGQSEPLHVGSIKTNIGHLEGCAGLAGLLKAILSLETGFIFPNLNFEKPNPRILLNDWNLKVPTKLTPWPTDGLRRASVNSFGYGGSNVHAVIDDAYHYLAERGLKGFTNTKPQLPLVAPQIDEAHADGYEIVAHPLTPPEPAADEIQLQKYPHKRLYLVSAPEQAAVSRIGSAYADYIDQSNTTEGQLSFLESLSQTLSTRRSQFPWRQGIVAATPNELAIGLREVKGVRLRKTPQIAFVFTGQGAQWAGMGKELMSYEVFAASVSAADTHLRSLGASWSVLEELDAPESISRVNEAEFSQPLCTVLQVALVDLLRHWGLTPSAVVGHSSGEIAAAYACGALSAADAYKVAYFRGRAALHISRVAPQLKGGMLAVGLSQEDAQAYLDKLDPSLVAVVACINSGQSVTLSGDLSALDVLEESLKADEVFVRRLKVDKAYHSPHMEYIADEYRTAIADVVVQDNTTCAFMSSVHGRLVAGQELNAEYWIKNMTSPVNFLAAVGSLIPDATVRRRQRNKEGAIAVDTFVELGPTGALAGPLKQIFASKNKPEGTLATLSAVTRKVNAAETALQLISKLWTMGAKGLDFARINTEKRQTSQVKTLVDLPVYPWNHATRYWDEVEYSRNHRYPHAPRLDLLGRPVEQWNPKEPRWINWLRISEQPWIEDHKVQGSIIFPAAGYICGVLEAAQQITDDTKTVKQFELRDITLGRALAFHVETDAVQIITTFKPRKQGLRASDAPWIEWSVYSNSDTGHIEHCSGLLLIRYDQVVSEIEGGQEEQIRRQKLSEKYHHVFSKSPDSVDQASFYAELNKIGLQYGPLFQGIQDIKTGLGGICCSTVKIPDTKAVMPMHYEYAHLLHPATLDACFQSIFAADALSEKPQAMVPTAIDSIRISVDLPKGAGATFHGFSTAERRGFRGAVGSVVMGDEQWSGPVIEVEGFTCTELGALTGGQAGGLDQSVPRRVCSYIRWEEDAQMQRQRGGNLLQRLTDLTPDHPYKAAVADSGSQKLKFTEKAEKMSAIFAKRALASLSAETEADLPQHLARYVAWLRQRNTLAQDGRLQHQFGSNKWLQMNEAEENKFLHDLVKTCHELKLLSAVGEALPAILNGTVQPQDVMAKDNMLLDFYASAHNSDIVNAFTQLVFNDRGHKQPKQRILEIGAGTATTSLAILKSLGGSDGTTARASSFVFTDVSASYFENAKKTLKPWTSICEYKRLDIDQEPVAQGLEAESFDVIVASNVLHSTKNIGKTLQHVKSLLKAGGELILVETTKLWDHTATIMGTLPEWWSHEDSRQNSPYMTEKEWQDALQQNGFTFNYQEQDTLDPLDHTWALISATKPVEGATVSFDKVNVIINDGTPSEHLCALSKNLEQDLFKQGIETQVVQMSQLLATQQPETDSLQGVALISLLEAEAPYLVDMTGEQFEQIRTLVLNSGALIWVTRGDKLGQNDPAFRMVDGMFRVINNEEDSVKLRRLDLEKTRLLQDKSTSTSILAALQVMFPQDGAVPETEIVIKNDQLMIPRLYDETYKDYNISMLQTQRAPESQPVHQESRPLRATIGIPGMLDTLHWIDDGRLLAPLGAEDVEIEVKATALNFVDIMIAMGIVPDVYLGIDFSGIVSRIGSSVTNLKVGDRVASIGVGTYATQFRAHSSVCQLLPDDMSLEDGASLAAVHMTAYQSLVEIGRLRKGESILIHAAAGGLGQAAIQLAQYIGAEIFVTVGSLSKKQLIIENYGIAEDHVFNSRDLTFAQAINRCTNGQGVDVILNSLAGEALRMSWSCIKEFGRFIEVGKKDILANTGLEMMPFLRNVTFAGVNVEHMFRNSIERTADLMSKSFDLIRQGHLKTVKPVTIYSMQDMEKAFRLMQQGKHSGKIVLSMQDDKTMVPVVPRDPHPLSLSSNSTYLLVGGLGGLGRAQAIWFAQNGATNLAFVSRSGAASDAAKTTMQKLEQLGVKAKAYACDIADSKALAATIAAIEQELPPIKGVIQGAMALADGFYRKMSYENWTKAVRPKVQGSWNLHELLPRDLDFFIMLSSISGVNGSRGQSNYGAGNTFEDALAHHRRSLGLVGTALDLGVMGGFGFVEENKDNIVALSHVVNKMPEFVIKPKEFYSILKSAITGYSEGEHSMKHQMVCGVGSGAMLAASQAEPGEWYPFDDALFSYIAHLDTTNTTAGGADGDSQLQAALTSATTLAECVEVMQDAIIDKLAKAMMIPHEDIDINKPMSTYGVDSLVAVEVRNWISREVKSDVNVFDLTSPVPMTQLINKIVSRSLLLSPEIVAEAVAAAGGSGGGVAAGAAATATAATVATTAADPTDVPAAPVFAAA